MRYSFIYLFLNFELQALSVFFLYVRCTAIDPADLGVMIDCDKTSKNRSKLDEELAGWNFILLTYSSDQNHLNDSSHLSTGFVRNLIICILLVNQGS